jgi:pimeloyl-ACP methyl ester carboxylesterase
MTELHHHFVTTNGIKLHYVEQGVGPLVVMCHGFPESWCSWRHQIPALAAAGFRVVAPDQRGYGQTEAPAAIDSYNVFNLVGDIVGLVSALKESQAIIVGHDWGTQVAWYSSLLRPDIFRACALLGGPYRPRGPLRPSIGWKALEGTDKHFYQKYFQEPGRVEMELDEDPRRSMAMILYSLSGDPSPEDRWQFLFPRSKKFIEPGVVPKKLPPWLTEADLEFFAGEFKRVGFRGGVNWYRNLDLNWELTGFLDGAKLRQPSMFATGEHDAVIELIGGDPSKIVAASMPNCRRQVIIPGAGHWIQLERPQQVSQLLVDFAKGL